MSKEKVKARFSNVLILLAAVLIVPVVLLLLASYEEVTRKKAWEKSEAVRLGLDTPTLKSAAPTPDTTALGPEDDFYRYLKARTEPAGEGGEIPDIIGPFVMKGDVLSRSKSRIDKGSFALIDFSGHWGYHWQEEIDWCIRIRQKTQGKDNFLRALWKLSEVNDSNLTGLSGVSQYSNKTSNNESIYIDTFNRNELLIPITTNWWGYSEKNIATRSWKFSPESGICNLTTRK